MRQDKTEKNLHTHSEPSDRSVAIGRWVHEHKGSTSNNLFGYTLYQFLRSAVASVPYGLSMAGTWMAFETVAQASEGKSKYLNMFTKSPLVRTGAMIGGSFTLYRATSKIGKWVNEYLFNPEDSLETTIDKVEHLPEMIKAKAKEVYLPEAHSTFISALVLSALVMYGAQNAGSSEHLKGALAQTKKMLAENGQFSSKAWGHFWKEAIAHPEAKFVQQAATNSLGYSLFFELGDRRFKDKQMSRGMWTGSAHSIGSSSRSNPSLLQEPLHGAEKTQQVDASVKQQAAGDLPEGSRMGDKLSIMTSEPSAMRWFTRRFVPTAVGITAYTALKFRGGKLFFGDFANPKTGLKEMSTFKGFMRNAGAEGAATSLFFMIPWVTDKYAPVHDKVVNNLEAAVSGRTYDEVVAGYQPKQRQNDTPNSRIAKPVGHEDRVTKQADVALNT